MTNRNRIVAGALALAFFATPAKAGFLSDLLGARAPHMRAYRPAPLLAVASHYLGARNFTGVGKWCRAAINVWARRAGIRLVNNSNRAIDALRLGPHVSNPRPGDLVVMRRHVTIFAGKSGGQIIGLGGNQHKRVQYSRYSPSRVLAYVRVAGM